MNSFSPFKLNNVKKYKREINPADFIKAQLLGIQQYITKEKELLDNILYWYLLPPFIGIVLFFVGLSRSV